MLEMTKERILPSGKEAFVTIILANPPTSRFAPSDHNVRVRAHTEKYRKLDVLRGRN